MRTSAIGIVLLLFSLVANGATTNYVCRFSLEASPRGMAKQTTPYELNFVSDSETKKAYLFGGEYSSEVRVIPNSSGVSFIEITDSGNVLVTTITSSGEAVHSKNIIMPGEKKLIPEQFYGTCTVR